MQTLDFSFYLCYGSTFFKKKVEQGNLLMAFFGNLLYNCTNCYALWYCTLRHWNASSSILIRIMQLILERINTRRSPSPGRLDGTKEGRPRWFLITTETVMQIGGWEVHVSNKHALLRSDRQIARLPIFPAHNKTAFSRVPTPDN